MIDGDFCLEFFGQPACYLPGKPVLSPIRLHKCPYQDEKQKQGEENSAGYFQKSPQVEICVKLGIWFSQPTAKSWVSFKEL